MNWAWKSDGLAFTFSQSGPPKVHATKFRMAAIYLFAFMCLLQTLGIYLESNFRRRLYSTSLWGVREGGERALPTSVVMHIQWTNKAPPHDQNLLQRGALKWRLTNAIKKGICFHSLFMSVIIYQAIDWQYIKICIQFLITDNHNNAMWYQHKNVVPLTGRI
jgi:hypothetical protein